MHPRAACVPPLFPRTAHVRLSAEYPEVPCECAHFKGIRRDGSLYGDKPSFIRPLERRRYMLFIRPLRFGETCWPSALGCRYDRNEVAYTAVAVVFHGRGLARRDPVDGTEQAHGP